MSYYVIERTTCSACEGQGVVQHPEWKTFWEVYRDDTNVTLHAAIDMHFGVRKMPPEEIQCSNCAGTGTITREVPLAEALASLKRTTADGLLA